MMRESVAPPPSEIVRDSGDEAFHRGNHSDARTSFQFQRWNLDACAVGFDDIPIEILSVRHLQVDGASLRRDSAARTDFRAFVATGLAGVRHDDHFLEVRDPEKRTVNAFAERRGVDC